MTRARHAALYVCGAATDIDDARLLLDALGLVVDGALAWPDGYIHDQIYDLKLRREGSDWRDHR